ncbi:non-heme iron oxygenase ferredoxin subunit [Leifsonia sp. H3M29-4]|uniref:non-heme iron oxygenase ferredoxin subunit n=1 Tax=Salinibacterium metalliresistens TaxID=3031321 RepID=UPI0023DB527E|nr:non-heme iron oxygenase ferredoxin subunit [Salinibacterium metalliresistens]MDF1479886.1 non-heme iron oxygenase ferredoxin subunit [Salinibacterium metalliresistens]
MTATRVCTIDELETDKAFRVVLDKVAIVLVKDSTGTVHAIGDTCTHGDISLAEGFVEDDGIECWAHGSKFSFTTGKPLNLPAYEPVPVFKVNVDEDGVISIDPSETLAVEA